MSDTESERWRLSRYAPPEPATGEWTVESVRDLVAAFGSISDILPFGIIANAHNAALAAEHKLCLGAIAAAAESQKQLDAEREVGGNTAIALARQITKLEDQLATVKELAEGNKTGCGTCHTILAALAKVGK